MNIQSAFQKSLAKFTIQRTGVRGKAKCKEKQFFALTDMDVDVDIYLYLSYKYFWFVWFTIPESISI